MSETSIGLITPPVGYSDWLSDLKLRIHTAQQRATLAVNRELVLLYWQIGHDILTRQAAQGWGSKVVDRLAQDLRATFPKMKGFSPRNLKYMRAFAEAWPNAEFVQQAAAQLPWGHNVVLLDKLPGPETRRWYIAQAIEHNWSRNTLVMHIEHRLLERSGKAVSNFEHHLPKPQSDLARESLKDPYRFDFLSLALDAQERDIENALIKHVTDFLLELGAGFAFVGQQVLLDVFKPEHLGKLSFYLSAVDAQLKHPQDGATIGLLLCKSKNEVVAEYALRDNNRPIGVAEYQLVESLPAELRTSLPSIEQIERELAGCIQP